MTRLEHLLVRAMEECNEVAQRLSKALIFGLDQIQEDPDDQPQQNPERLDNRERIRREYVDLKAVLEMVDVQLTGHLRGEIHAKQAKVERYLDRSRRCGTLQECTGPFTDVRDCPVHRPGSYPAPSPVLRCQLADEPHVHTQRPLR